MGREISVVLGGKLLSRMGNVLTVKVSGGTATVRTVNCGRFTRCLRNTTSVRRTIREIGRRDQECTGERVA